MKSLVVVPAYNEGQNIRQVLVALPEASVTFDVLVIDDCSTDNTGDVVAELGIPQIRLPCNLGYARAVQTGLRYAVNHEYEVEKAKHAVYNSLRSALYKEEQIYGR